MSMIDLNFRPETYWPEAFTPDQLLSRVKGKVRRDIAKSVFSEQGFIGLTEFLSREELEDDARDRWGGIHPAMMGGEYLPNLEPGEVEIAVISLRSVMCDQISVRAKPLAAKIKYRVACEYEDMGLVYVPPFDESEKPLTLAELMQLIDGSKVEDGPYPGGLLASNWAMMQDSCCDEEEIVSFLSLSSTYYPELGNYYHVLASNWLAENFEEEVADE